MDKWKPDQMSSKNLKYAIKLLPVQELHRQSLEFASQIISTADLWYIVARMFANVNHVTLLPKVNKFLFCL